MKKYLVVFNFLMLAFQVNAQYASLVTEIQINDNRSYFWNTRYSESMDYLIANQSYLGTYLFDTSLNLIKSIETRCAACGGGNGRLTFEDEYFIGGIRNWMDEKDTVWAFNLKSGDVQHYVWEQHASYFPFPNERKILVSYWGKFWTFDMEKKKLKLLPINMEREGFPKATPQCLIVDNGKHVVIQSKERGLQLYETKKWKLVKNIDPSVDDLDKIHTTTDNKYYYYVNGNLGHLRRMEDHKLIHELEVDTKVILNTAYATDLSYGLYLNLEKEIVYFDLNSELRKSILTSDEYLTYSDLCIHPNNKEFFTAPNGNRLSRFRLHMDGDAPEDNPTAKPHVYSEEDAARSEEKILRVEYALKKKGYTIVLDNMVTDSDRFVFKMYCEKNGFKNVWTEESLKSLGIE